MPRRASARDKLPSRDRAAGVDSGRSRAGEKTRRNLEAPLAVVDAIAAAATLPFDEGCLREREHLRRLRHVRAVQGADPRVLRRARRLQGSGRPEGRTSAADQRPWRSSAPARWAAALRWRARTPACHVIMTDTAAAALDAGMARIRANYDTLGHSAGDSRRKGSQERMGRIQPQARLRRRRRRPISSSKPFSKTWR